RPDQGRSHRAAERGLGRVAAAHHRGDDRRAPEEGRAGSGARRPRRRHGRHGRHGLLVTEESQPGGASRPMLVEMRRSFGSVVLIASQAHGAPDLARRIDAVMKPRTRADGPGCAVGVVQHETLVFAKGYGMADLEHAIPITADTVFDIASMSKQFTAASI